MMILLMVSIIYLKGFTIRITADIIPDNTITLKKETEIRCHCSVRTSTATTRHPWRTLPHKSNVVTVAGGRNPLTVVGGRNPLTVAGGRNPRGTPPPDIPQQSRSSDKQGTRHPPSRIIIIKPTTRITPLFRSTNNPKYTLEQYIIFRFDDDERVMNPVTTRRPKTDGITLENKDATTSVFIR
jgi:hypothetical protein